MIDGLKDKHRKAIIEVLASNDRVERAILFGSRAMETFTPGSDVDIALFGDDLTMTDQGRFAAALEESTIPQRVDLVLYDQIDNDALREHIRRHGVEWYRRPKSKPACQLRLQPRHRRMLEALLQEHLPGVEVWAYGSRVNGRAHDGSDLDLVLRGPGLEKIPVEPLANFEEAVRESNIPFPVEARDWARLPAGFRAAIERGYVTFFPRKKMARNSCEKKRGDTEGGPAIGVGWRNLRWGDLATLEYGKALRSYRESTGAFQVFGTNGPIGWHSEALCTYASVIIGRKGAYRGVHYSPRPFSVIDTAFYLKPKTEFDTRWAYYELLRQDINGMDSRSAIPSTSREAFYRLPVCVPPLAEQHAIAHILGALDDKIELNRRMNETLEAMARAVFKDWFVDFGPVRAKMEGRETRLPRHVAELFPNRLVPSAAGVVPHGWRVGRLMDVARSPRRGVAPFELNRETHYIGLEHMPRRSVALSTWEGVSKVMSSKSVFRKGEILFGKLRPYFHKVGVAPVDGVCSTDIVVIASKAPMWANFVLGIVSSKKFVAYTAQTSTGTKMPRTNWQTMGSYVLPLPPSPVVRAFQDITEPLFKRINLNVHNSLALASLRDRMLPKLISGELRVETDEEELVRVL